MTILQRARYLRECAQSLNRVGATVRPSLSELEYASEKKQTQRDRFLAEVEAVTPRVIPERTIAPFYPNSGGRDWPPIGLGRMPGICIAQHCFGLSDEGIEDALHDSQANCRFVGIGLNHESAPDAPTLLNFIRRSAEERAES